MYRQGTQLPAYALAIVALFLLSGGAEGDPTVTVDNQRLEWSHSADNTINAVDISADGEYIVSCDDNFIHLFDKDSDTPLWSGHTEWGGSELHALAISADGEYIITGANTGKVYLWNQAGSNLWIYGTGESVQSVDISADGEYIVAGSDNNGIFLFDKDSNSPIWSYYTGSDIHSVAISANGEYIVVGSEDDYVYLFDKDSANPLWNYYAGGGNVETVSISADGEYIAIGSSYPDKKVYLFNKDSSTPLWSYASEGSINSVSISTDGEYIVAGSENNYAYLFSKDNSTPLWSYQTDNDVLSVDISADGKYIVAGSENNYVYLFDEDSDTPVWSYYTGGDVYSVAISADGEYFAASGSSGVSTRLFSQILDPTNSQSATLTVTASDEVECDFDDIVVECDEEITGIAEGSHTFTATATDSEGNTSSDSFTWYVDLTDPTVTMSNEKLEWSHDTGNMYSVSISADGEYIVAGSYDNKVYLYSKDSSTPLWSYDTGYDVKTVAISADGEYVVAGGYDNVYLFHKDNSTPLWSHMLAGGEYVNSVAISTDGEYIVAGWENYEVRLFNKDSSSPLWSYETVGNVKVAISADGEYIAVGSEDDNVYLFDKDDSTPLWSYDTGNNVKAVSISADGEYIVAGSDNEKVYLFDRDSSTPLWIYDADDKVYSVSISADGEYIAASSHGGSTGGWVSAVHLFERESSTPLWSYIADNLVWSVAASSNGEYIAAGSADHNFYLFDKDSSTPLFSYDTEGVLKSVAISNNGDYMVAGAQAPADSTYLFSQFLDPTNSQSATFTVTIVDEYSAGSAICDLDGTAVNCDGEFDNLTEGSHTFTATPTDAAGNVGDSESFTWYVDLTDPTIDVDGTGLKWRYYYDDVCSNCGYEYMIDLSADGTYAVAGTQDGKVYLLEGDSGELIWTYSEIDQVTSVKISADGEYITVGSDNGHIYLFNKDSNTLLWDYDTGFSGGAVRGLAISADGEYIAAGCDCQHIYLFDKDSSTPLWSYNINDGSNSITSIAISADGTYIVLGSDSNSIYLFNKDSSTPLWNYNAEGSVWSVDISVDGEYIVAGSQGEEVHLFNKDSNEPLWSYDTDDSKTTAVSISADGEYIAAGSGGGTIFLFEKDSSTPLWSYENAGYVWSIDMTAGGDYMTAGTSTDRVFVFSKDSSTPEFIYEVEVYVKSVAISDNGERFAAGMGSSGDEDDEVYLGAHLFSHILNPNNNQDASLVIFANDDYSLDSIICEIDGDTVECDGEFENLEEGSHTLTATVTDDAGNTATDSFTWYIDLTDPTVSIDSQPDEVSNNDSAEFTFTVSDDYSLSGTKCKLDDADWVTCTSPVSYASLSEGSHTFTVIATDEAGNDASASYSWVFEFIPETTITSTPDDPSNSQSATFEFASDRESATFECSIDDGAWEECSSPYEYNDLEESSHNFSVKACIDVDNCDETPAEYEWYIDLTNPTVSIESGPDEVTNSDNATFTFSASDDYSIGNILCDLDSMAVECDEEINDIYESSHTFTVSVYDAAGNSASASYSWYVDLTNPTVSIDSGPDDPSESSSATFTFSASDDYGLSSTNCKLDDADWVTCTSPVSYENLNMSSHTFTVEAVDEAGNAEQVTYDWVVAVNPPETTIDSGPENPTDSQSATFEFTSDNESAVFECSIDGGAWEECSSPYEYDALEEGSHNVSIRACLEDDNCDGTPAEHEWYIDLTDPAVSIDGPANPTNSNSANFTVTATDDYGIESIVCDLDGETVTCDDEFDSLAEGSHTFSATATDEVGNNASASYTWYIDLTDPTVIVSEREIELNYYGGYDNAEMRSIAISADGEYTVVGISSTSSGYTSNNKILLFDKDSDEPLWDYVSGYDVRTVAISADGEYIVAGSDASDTSSATGKVYLFDKDSDEPLWSYDTGSNVRSIDISADGEYITASTYDNNIYLFHKDSNTPVWSYDTGALVWSIDISADGEYIVAGNDDGVIYLFDKDSNTPTWNYETNDAVYSVAISADGEYVAAGTWGDKVYLFEKNNSTPLWSYNAGEDVYIVAISANGEYIAAGSDNDYVYLFEKNSSTPLWSYDTDDYIVRSVDISADGEYIVAGTYNSSIYLFDKDSSVPLWNYDTGENTNVLSVAISADGEYLTAGTSNDNLYLFSQNINANTNEQSVTFAVTTSDDYSMGSTSCDLDGTTVACDEEINNITEGSHTFTATATDAAGNSASASYTWYIDLTNPIVSIDSYPDDPSNDDSPPFTVTASDDGSGLESATCTLDGTAFDCTGGTVEEGSHTFRATAIDNAGNSASASYTWYIDLTDPTVSVTGGPADPTNSQSAGFSISANDDYMSGEGGTEDVSLIGGVNGNVPANSCSWHWSIATTGGTHTIKMWDSYNDGWDDTQWGGSTVGSVTIYDSASGTTVASLSFPSSSGSYTEMDFDYFGSEIDIQVCGDTYASAEGSYDITIMTSTNVEVDCEFDDTIVTCEEQIDDIAEGSHTFNVTVTDEAGNTASASYSWYVDLTNPTVEITNVPPDPSNSTNPTFNVTPYDDYSMGSTTCDIDGNVVDCTNITGLSDGSHTFTATPTDAAGNVGDSESFTWYVDLTNPTILIDSELDNTTNNQSANFTVTVTDNYSGAIDIICDLDGTAVDCDEQFENLTEGSHTFTVAATDLAGNTASDSYTWYIDLTNPTVTIDSGPDNPSYSSSATFTFSASDNYNLSSINCKLDDGDWVACTSPISYGSLSEGSHTFIVEVVDEAGNVENSSYEWIIESNAPQTTIISAPDNSTNSQNATFEFTSDNESAVFECSIDGGAWEDCESPYEYDNLEEGNHTFSVKACIENDECDISPAEYEWYIDLTDPTASIIDTPSDPTNNQSATFTISVNDDYSIDSTTCDIDGDLVDCTNATVSEGSHTFTVTATDEAGNTASDSYSWYVDLTDPSVSITNTPNNPTNNANAAFTVVSGDDYSMDSTVCDIDGTTVDCAGDTVSEGSHTFTATATDTVGNFASASYTWLVDLTDPTLNITDVPSDPTNSQSMDFNVTANDDGSGLASTTCELDSATQTDCGGVASNLAEGWHTFTATATDEVGNSASASYNWYIDLTDPDMEIDGPADPTNNNSAEFEIESGDSGGSGIASITCEIDDEGVTECTDSASYNNLEDGSHTFTVIITDNVGNSASASYTWVIDTVLPTATITSGPEDEVADDMGATFTFTGDDDSSGIESFECGIYYETWGWQWEDCTSPYVVQDHLDDGENIVAIRAIDQAGNTGDEDSYSWIIDTTAPTVTITGNPDYYSNDNTATFTFEGDDGEGVGGITFECYIFKIDDDYEACTSPYDTGEIEIDDDYTFQVRAIDSLGNTGDSDNYYWLVDTTDPTVSISDVPNDPTNIDSAEFTVESDDNGSELESTTCALDDADVVCDDEFTDLEEGSHTFTATATDNAGNSASASYTWYTDLTDPTVSLSDTPSDPSSDTSVSITVTSADDYSMGSTSCTMDGDTVDCDGSATMSEGYHTFIATATDAAGNSASASHSWYSDLTAPIVAITSGPADPSNDADPAFSVASGDNYGLESTVCDIDGSAVDCAGGDVSEGSHTFTATATDQAGNGASASYTWYTDLTDPTVSISSGPADPTNDDSASFTVTASDDYSLSGVACDLDGSSVGCSDLIEGLAEGSHTFTATATDTAGNSASASYTWYIDLTDPTVSIGDIPADPTNDDSASFTVSAGDDYSLSGVACDIDGAAVDCAGGTVSEGSHTFTITATDNAGNSASASYTWYTDLTDPTVTIDSGPDNATASSNATFAFSATDDYDLSDTNCRINEEEWGACTSPISYYTDDDGSYTFTITATDTAGNTASALYSWYYDLTDPYVNIYSGPDDPTNNQSATFAATIGDDYEIESIICEIDGDEIDCNEEDGIFTLYNISEGARTFTIRVFDTAGNQAVDPYSWYIDLTDPTVSIDSGPDEIADNRSATFTITYSDDMSDIGSIECALDDTDSSSCEDSITYDNLNDGTHTFTVTVMDEAGNSVSASFNWYISVSYPTVSIDSGPSSLTNNNTATFVFSADEEATFEFVLDDSNWTATSDVLVIEGLADGEHALRVRATDLVGNIGAESSTYTWTVDTEIPIVQISSGPATPTNTPAATFEFSNDDPALSLECSLDSGEWEVCTSPASYDNLSDGEHSFKVRSIDTVGNVGESALWTWYIDLTAPEIGIETDPEAFVTYKNVSIEFTVDDSGATSYCSLDNANWTICESPMNYTEISEGEHTFRMKAEDLLGNEGESVSISWMTDTVGPVVDINGEVVVDKSDKKMVNVNFTFGSNEDNVTYFCMADWISDEWEECSGMMHYENLTFGDYIFSVKAMDTYGNEGNVKNYNFTNEAGADTPSISTVIVVIVLTSVASLISTIKRRNGY